MSHDENLLERLRRNQARWRRDRLTLGRGRRQWVDPNTSVPFHRIMPLMARVDALEAMVGDKPAGWRKPTYGNLDYIIAWRMGWISDTEEKQDRARYELRRARSLEYCSEPALRPWRGDWSEDLDFGITCRRRMPDITGGYIPEVPSHVLHDVDLSDGARRCLLKILEETYRNNREGRWLATTVPYLATALGRARRTIQYYLRLLEMCGYIGCEVIVSAQARMCNGLKITLTALAFPKHAQEAWPKRSDRSTSAQDDMDDLAAHIAESEAKSGAQKESLNYFRYIYRTETFSTQSVWSWSAKCMLAIKKRLMENCPPPEDQRSPA